MRHLGKIFVILLLALVALMGYWYYRSQAVVSVKNTPAKAEDQQALLQETINVLTKFIVLPQDDAPVLAVVTDPAVLAKESFFQDAKVGDRVLIYPKNHKAILYRPSIGKVIQMETLPVAPTAK
jgi:hypothetical protein